MNTLDFQYKELIEQILNFGVEKEDRTGTGTLSLFGWQIRHSMRQGFPILTTKKMAWKSIVTELLWFLRGDTNIKYLVDNGCHIWDGDAFKNFMDNSEGDPDLIWNKEQFINLIKTDSEFAKKWGDLGPIYGKQWRQWQGWVNTPEVHYLAKGSVWYDQIQQVIHQLKTNPDSRRLIVNAWNVADLDNMVLPPCHYSFQFYTRKLSFKERSNYYMDNYVKYELTTEFSNEFFDANNIPSRAISLLWNQRSVDTFLGLPFNISSYGLLLSLIAKEVNMIPDELIGNLGDAHLYKNHIDQAKELIKRRPYDLPKLFLDFELTKRDGYLVEWDKIVPSRVVLVDYKSHPAIKAPLSN